MPQITSIDRQNLLVTFLSEDADVMAAFPGITIKTADPEGVEADPGFALAVDISGEHTSTDSLGPSGIGARDAKMTQLALIVYVWAGTNRDGAKKTDCVVKTNAVIAAVRKHTTASQSGAQYWHSIEFELRKNLTTTYHYQQGRYASLTILNLYAQNTR